jgi:hypothetical protein
MEDIMLKKNVWLGMVGIALTFGLLVGCAGTPEVRAGAELLSGKTAVILPLTVAERVKAKDTTTTITGIGRLLAVAAVVDDYAKDIDELVERNSEAIAAKSDASYAAFIAAYNAAYNSTPSKVSFDFGKKTPDVSFFAKPSKDTAAKIAQLCADNNAEYAIALLYQLVDGPVVTVLTTGDTTSINLCLVVLDKTGAVVSTSYATSDAAEFRFAAYSAQQQEELDAAHDVRILELYDAFLDALPTFAADL